ncbi:MAG TPA: DHH family phosphoesterase, partial [Thermoanaerobaculia bacterium]|nr:DHH family phosphoesterase [Thermoanaerobaculia bacterium]
MNDDLTRLRYEAFGQFVHGTPSRAAWLILTHDNPDPDALVSMALLARLLRQVFRRHATIAYGGMIGRAENREMVRVLGLEMVHMREISWRTFDLFALVDSQPRTGNNQLPADLTPHVVIDHHPPRKASLSCPFVDIRRDYGATATILAEYLQASG